MKRQPHANTTARPPSAPFYKSVRPAAARPVPTETRLHPPRARHPRYPSLSDVDQSPLISVRMIALLTLIALIVALAAGL